MVSIAGKKTLALARGRSRGLCSGRDFADPARHKAAARLLRRLLNKQSVAPKRIVTDKLGSYAAARRKIMPEVEHRSHKGHNNRAENSHLPFRRRERWMHGFRSPGGLQRFETYSPPSVTTLFRPAPAAPLCPSTCIVCTLWPSGSSSSALPSKPALQTPLPSSIAG